jgi:3-methyladenine DNA glycosylase AlkD
LHRYTQAVQSLFTAHTDALAALPMKRYMRDQFDYLGIKIPHMRALLNEHIAEHGLPEEIELDTIVRELWALPQREYQYAGESLLGRLAEQLQPEFIGTLEYLLVTKSWWDTVDGLAAGPVGTHFRRYPDVRGAYLSRWRGADDFWLRRTTLLFQLNYKAETDFDLLCTLIRENLGSKEFFINKAIGWALRQYSRVDPQGVCAFVAATPLHPLSAREALKWLKKKENQEIQTSS